MEFYIRSVISVINLGAFISVQACKHFFKLPLTLVTTHVELISYSKTCVLNKSAVTSESCSLFTLKLKALKSLV